ncbi:helix-turn-helix domain-containing protein [Halocatena marina]|uniref:Helix-turn-helix domain-containing protein n=1 Tax=Halocatena marina TaxID=2934937 RepID=A0ABD5YSG7_9EURY|nr:helix-turn-helix domain-containing protein [Halocatena marina]
MRAITFVVTPPKSHPAYQMFDEESQFTRERIYNLNVLEDGTMVLLGRVRGDLEQIRLVVEAQLDTLGFSISGTDGDGGLVYIHVHPPTEIKRFLELPREHEVFFDFPVEGTRDGKLRFVMIGETNEVLQQALADMPETMDFTIERISAYSDESGAVLAVLTDRQRDVLDVALELNYYDAPRQATHHDIAEQLGLSVGTVTEHLQKIEASVFGAFR